MCVGVSQCTNPLQGPVIGSGVTDDHRITELLKAFKGLLIAVILALTVMGKERPY
jgi:hypothetical protein